jgi:hypothetical protein
MSNSSPDILHNALRLSVQTPTSRLELARCLWEPQNRHSLAAEAFQPPTWEAYFGYYQDQCITWLCDKFSQDLSQDKTHRQLISKAREIAGLDAHKILPLLLSQDSAERSWMFLAVRVLTMIDVGGLASGIRLGQVSRNWTHGSLRDFIKLTFPDTKELPDNVKLERLFTARNLEWVADIQVIWTSNLADHLQLEDDDTKVRVFSHASFLELHRDW